MTGQKKPTAKYFLGIVIPSPIYEEIEDIKAQLFKEHNLRGALRSPAHITLHRPFEWPEEKENQLIELLRHFDRSEEFEIVLQNFGVFPPRVIFVSVQHSENLFQLHDALTAYAKTRLRLFNEAEDMRGFHPHITIAFRDLKRRHFEELMPIFQKRVFSASFSYSGFSLLKLDKTWKELCFFPFAHH